MSMIEDMLAKAQKQYDESVKREKVASGYIYGNATKDNCVELANVYRFLDEYGFSDGILDENTVGLTVEYDPLSANPGYSYKNKVYIRGPEDLGVLTHEMFHLASSDYDSDERGITVVNGEKKNGVALNEGITDYLARLVDPEYIPQYPCELVVAKRLIDGFGMEILNGYFDADRYEFEEYFGKNTYYLNNLISLLDKYEDLFYKNDINGLALCIVGINMELAKLGLREINPTDITEELKDMRKKTL